VRMTINQITVDGMDNVSFQGESKQKPIHRRGLGQDQQPLVDWISMMTMQTVVLFFLIYYMDTWRGWLGIAEQLERR